MLSDGHSLASLLLACTARRRHARRNRSDRLPNVPIAAIRRRLVALLLCGRRACVVRGAVVSRSDHTIEQPEQPDPALAELPLDLLAQRATQETEKFSRRQPNDQRFAYELIRRALAEKSDDAFAHVYRIYEPQVLGWVYGYSRFVQTDESAEFFVGAALRTFYVALRGEKFARFSSLPQILTYLKMCVHTSIAQYIRDQQTTVSVPLDEIGEVAQTPDLGTRAEASALWTYIATLLPDPRDQLLARCAFIQDLMPRQILAAYPTHWSSEREISVALYRIRRVLRADPQLRIYGQP